MARHLRDGQLASIVSSAGAKLVAVDFSNEGCPPCRAIKPWWDSLPAKYPNIIFCTIMCSDCPGDASSHNITATPTFVFFLKGKEIKRVRGADKTAIVQVLEQHKNSGGGFSGQGRSIGAAPPAASLVSSELESYNRAMLLDMGFPRSLVDKVLADVKGGSIDECVWHIERLQKPGSNSNMCTIRLNFADGYRAAHMFRTTDTLEDVCAFVKIRDPDAQNKQIAFESQFPPEVFDASQFSRTLADCKLVPRAQLNVKYL